MNQIQTLISSTPASEVIFPPSNRRPSLCVEIVREIRTWLVYTLFS